MTNNGNVLSVIKSFTEGSYHYELLGYNNFPSFLHINNHLTNTNAVIVPIDAVKKIIALSNSKQH